MFWGLNTTVKNSNKRHERKTKNKMDHIFTDEI